MKTIRVRHSTNDVLLTTANRLSAEPANTIRPGDLGVRYDGRGGIPRQVDTQALSDAFLEGLNLLSPGERQAVLANIAKAAGGGEGARRVSPTGIVSNDASAQARRAVADIRANIANNQAVAKGYKDFWDPRVRDSDSLARGR